MAKKKAHELVVPYNTWPAEIKKYRGVAHKDVSTNKGYIFFSHPTQRWILVQKRGDTAVITFHAECPCSTLDGDPI